MEAPVQSPCIAICTMEGEICIGCGRTLEEIAGWSGFNDGQKEAVLERATERLWERGEDASS